MVPAPGFWDAPGLCCDTGRNTLLAMGPRLNRPSMFTEATAGSARSARSTESRSAESCTRTRATAIAGETAMTSKRDASGISVRRDRMDAAMTRA